MNNKTKRRNTKNKSQHYFVQSPRTATNKRRKRLKQKCDCYKHERQVCDICQNVVGKKLTDKIL